MVGTEAATTVEVTTAEATWGLAAAGEVSRLAATTAITAAGLLCAPAITTAAGIAGGIGAGSVPTPIDPGVLETTVQRLPPAAAARFCATNVESHGFRKGSPRILDAAKLTDFERDASLGAGYWAVEVASVVHANWMPAHHE